MRTAGPDAGLPAAHRYSKVIDGLLCSLFHALETALTEGAGVRAFYAHQFQPFMNWQNLGYTLKLPQSAVNDIWTR